VPALVGNAGYWCTLELTVSSLISAGWQDNNDSRNQVLVYAGNPFRGQADPTIGPPPAGNLAGLTRTDDELWAATPGCQPPGTYTVLFFNGGVPMTSATLATVVPDECADPG
jgi:hypothetical protein